MSNLLDTSTSLMRLCFTDPDGKGLSGVSGSRQEYSSESSRPSIQANDSDSESLHTCACICPEQMEAAPSYVSDAAANGSAGTFAKSALHASECSNSARIRSSSASSASAAHNLHANAAAIQLHQGPIDACDESASRTDSASCIHYGGSSIQTMSTQSRQSRKRHSSRENRD